MASPRLPAAAASGGCTRAITNVGDVTGPRTPRPSPIPWVRVVLPAPSPPRSITRSPARRAVARDLPSARISAAVETVNETLSSSFMVRPRHARANARHDLVRDRAERLAPLLGRRFPVVPRSEEHYLIPLRYRLVAEVNEQLVHADRARDPPAPAAGGPQRQAGRGARDPVGVAERHEAQSRLARRGVPVPVRHPGSRGNPFHEHEPGPQRHRRPQPGRRPAGESSQAVAAP